MNNPRVFRNFTPSPATYNNVRIDRHTIRDIDYFQDISMDPVGRFKGFDTQARDPT